MHQFPCHLRHVTGPPPGANMGIMNPEMMGMMPQHDMGMGFDMSAGTRSSKHVLLTVLASLDTLCINQ